MWFIHFVVVGWLTTVSGHQVISEGCFSVSFVQQYAFYYKINFQSLPLEQSFAACNHRLTKYIGLQVDKSAPAYNFVYCGNDLAEVSNKVPSGCHPCQENHTLSCGGDGSMYVYKLRGSTPFSLLLATNRGVEMLLDNTTTLLVSYTNSSEFKYVDYIYTEDTIISAIHTDILRSFYNMLTMKYTHHYSLRSFSYTHRSLAVDWNESTAYFGLYGVNDLYKIISNKLQVVVVLSQYYVPKQISVDSYNRSLVFLQYPYNTVCIFLLDKMEFFCHTLDKLHVFEINALAMESQEKLLYGILTINGDSETYLVSLDYGISQMRVLFSGPHLVNATVLKVFKGEAVWLRNVGSTSTIYKCKLTPRCSNFTFYQVNQFVSDFTIYHPEKQTPGEKLLCANMTCDHGCKAFSPFTARCICPPGIDLYPDNNTCYERPSTPKSEATSTPSVEDPKESNEMSTSPNISPPLINISLSIEKSTEKNKSNDAEISNFNIFVVICFIVVFILLVVIVAFFADLYRKNTKIAYVLEQRHELKELGNEYVEIPILKRQ